MRAEADDGGHAAALGVQLFRNGERNGAADTAADHADITKPLGLGRSAERTDKVGYRVARAEPCESRSGRADSLKYYSHGACRAVKARNGERNAFAVGIHAQYYELPRLRLARNERRLYLHKRYGGIEFFFFCYSVHCDLRIIVFCFFCPDMMMSTDTRRSRWSIRLFSSFLSCKR